MFGTFQRSNSAEDCFKPIQGGHYSIPSDLFCEDDVLSSPPSLFSGPSDINSDLSSDSDLETELLRSQSPTEYLTSTSLQKCGFPSNSSNLQQALLGTVQPLSTTSNTSLLSSVSSFEEVKKCMMEKFPPDKVSDFKHVIYNLLVDHYNNPELVPFIEPVQIVLDGEVRTGFRFLEGYNPDKKLPELYAQHIRRARLDLENHESIFIQDLYKFYLRAVLELLAKYFEKCDKYTFLDDDAPLFVPGTSLKESEARMKTMRTRARKRKTANRDAKKPSRKVKRDW